MAYYTAIFSPETYELFMKSDQQVFGFKENLFNPINTLNIGDKLVCYLTKISRWFGVLEIASEYFRDTSPLFVEQDDPYVIRYKVKPIVVLEPDFAFYAKNPEVWNNLSFTKDLPPGNSDWTYIIRKSFNSLLDTDGEFLETILQKQITEKKQYPLTTRDRRKMKRHIVKRSDGFVSILIPDEPELEEAEEEEQEVNEIVEVTIEDSEIRESLRIQAKMAEVGSLMGYKIWLPRNDSAKVRELCKAPSTSFLNDLPFNYEEATIATIKNIDLIWIKGRSIVRAFEIEHTTSIYSGLLRMADLLALQPNMDIKLHIVAPNSRREKVFQEIRRPVFSLLERAPLYKCCTYISYESVDEISKQPNLECSTEKLVDKFAEEAE